jgi:hypothetical protein
MKLDPGMHIGLHLVFFGKSGVTQSPVAAQGRLLPAAEPRVPVRARAATEAGGLQLRMMTSHARRHAVDVQTSLFEDRDRVVPMTEAHDGRR